MRKRFFIEHEETYKGYKLKCVLQSLGHRCGYVHLPNNHEFAGKDYDDIQVSCHGGLTYAEYEDNDYVIGFDCGHCMDAHDFQALKDNGMYDASTKFLEDLNTRYPTRGIIRTKEYVINECKSIIDQLTNPTDEQH